MLMPIAELWGIDWLVWWQIPLVLVLIGLIIFLKKYRESQR